MRSRKSSWHWTVRIEVRVVRGLLCERAADVGSARSEREQLDAVYDVLGGDRLECLPNRGRNMRVLSDRGQRDKGNALRQGIRLSASDLDSQSSLADPARTNDAEEANVLSTK